MNRRRAIMHQKRWCFLEISMVFFSDTMVLTDQDPIRRQIQILNSAQEVVADRNIGEKRLLSENSVRRIA